MDFKAKLAEAVAYREAGLRRVANEPEPPGQKFAVGTRVKIADDLGPTMQHFTAGGLATVCYTYAHAYPGANIRTDRWAPEKSYCLDIDGEGRSSWYYEHQLEGI